MQLECQLWLSGIENFKKWFQCLIIWPLICAHENLLMSGYVQWMILLSMDKKILKKMILLILLSKYLKLIYFDILEYFHIVKTYFATLQDFFL